jgi:hypothetical protein
MRRFVILFAMISVALLGATGRARPQRAGQSDAPPTEAERNAILDRVFANQHIDDDALPLFQRVERRQFHGRDADANSIEDKTVRIVPTGIGSARIALEDHGHPNDPGAVRAQMALVEHQLEVAMDDSNPQTKRDREKFEHRNHERNELVSELRKAYIFAWQGREVRNGRPVVKFHMEPNPSYQPTSTKTEMFSHAKATVWVDEHTSHVVRLEVELISDIPFYGGLAAKVYRGGKMVIEQSEVEPGVWLPSLYQYDFSFRKFIFPSEYHERVEASHYVRVGSPKEALLAIRRELSAPTSNPLP